MKFSILLTCFNDAKYLNTSIRSILDQTFNDFELVIVDDGSTDSSENVVKVFKDKRIKYIKIEHRGRAYALNFGLGLCSNDWVTLADADDIFLPNRLEEYSKISSINKNSIVSCWIKVFGSNNKIIYSIKPPVDNTNLKKVLLLHSIIPNCVLYNKNFILDNDGYNENLNCAIDYDLWLKLYDKANFIIIPKFLTLVRYRKDSLSNYELGKTKSTVYQLQEKYLSNYYKIIEPELKGWREYFYGNVKSSRNIWNQLGLKIFLNLRILIAYFLTFFGIEFSEQFKKYRIKYRFKNIKDIFTKKNNYYNIFLKKIE